MSLFFLGLEKRIIDDSSPHYTQRVDKDRWALHFGYKAGPMVSKAAGISFVFNCRRFRRSEVQKIEVPPPCLWGRAALVRFVSKGKDITIIGGYPPPHGAKQNSTAQATASKVNEWVRQK